MGSVMIAMNLIQDTKWGQINGFSLSARGHPLGAQARLPGFGCRPRDRSRRPSQSAWPMLSDRRPMEHVRAVGLEGSSLRCWALTRHHFCNTLHYMKNTTLTLRLDKELSDMIKAESRRSGRSRSEVAREALKRQLRLSRFESLRRRALPFAEARGILLDEDVFGIV